MTEVVIAAAARTPIGSYGKSLKDVPPKELGALAAKTALERANVAPEQVEHVVWGNVIHTEPADMYMARVVSMNAEIPKEVPAYTVNRLCGTGVQAIVTAAQTILTGDADVVLAGGAESMSRGPYWLPQTRWGARMGDSKIIDPVLGGLTDPFHQILMGVTAENLAEKYGISREEQDEFAIESHRRASEAQAAGKFDAEVVPVPVKTRKGIVEFARDEHIRHDASQESMAKLKPAFKAENGTVTAGNSSGMNDAGAATVLLSAEKAKELGVKPLAKILSWAACGVEPKYMGIGPVPAVEKALKRAGRSLSEIGVIELNEAFAAQSIAVLRDLKLDLSRTNPNGGAIALGHPIGASGTIVTTKALYEMQREGHELGLVTLCIGGGQGIALLLAQP